jgi:hypothetical protein
MNTAIYQGEEVFNSNGFVKNFVTFPNPKTLLEPFFENHDFLKLNDIVIVEGSHPTQLEKDGNIETAFGRVNAKALIPMNEEMNYTIGYVVSLEQQKMILKAYAGAEVKACLNLAIWTQGKIRKFDASTPIDQIKKELKEFFADSVNDAKKITALVEKMKSIKLSALSASQILGIVLNSIVKDNGKGGSTSVVDAVRLLNDKNSRYFIGHTGTTDLWNVYNALTENLNGKVHILDQPEKVQNLCEVLIKAHNTIFDYSINIAEETEAVEVLEVLENRLKENFEEKQNEVLDINETEETKKENATAKPKKGNGRKK